MEVDDQVEPAPVAQRKTTKELIEHYFHILREGCGNSRCLNMYCASSARFYKHAPLPPNDAALEAVRLIKEKVPVKCTDVETSQITNAMHAQIPLSNNATSNDNTLSVSDLLLKSKPSTSSASGDTTSSLVSALSAATKSFTVKPLTESLVLETVEICKQHQKWSELVKLIGGTFSQIDVLKRSFRLEEADETTGLTLDLPSLRNTYSALYSLPELPFNSALINALTQLSDDLLIELQYRSAFERDPEILNVILIVLNLPCLDSPEYIEKVYPRFLKAMTHLPLQGRKSLVQTFVCLGREYQRSLLTSLQQLLTIRVVSQSEKWSSQHVLNYDEHIACAAKVMKLVYYASLLGGRLDDSDTLSKERENSENLKKSVLEFMRSVTERSSVKERAEVKEDPLAQVLGIRALDCREPLIHRLEFVNEMINETLATDQDFAYYKAQNGTFTFIEHSFLLSTATKSMAMYCDNKMRMISERRSAILSSLMHGRQLIPYLRLRVRRDHIIDDALVGLEMVFMDNPQDLKKQLYVEFDGEQGIDEGGVSKEFFQLITDEIFNPDFGMFAYDEDTRHFWFNPDSFENDAQFTLVGILLGLAIYNSIILDIRLPMVVYRKLMGKLGTLDDMELSHPVLYSSLNQLMRHEGNVEEDIMATFTLSRTNMFGETISHSLKEGGAELSVTNENREEYCHLYADYMLNKMVEKQFNAFFKGFHMVTDESPIETLFTAEEIEELVCGSSAWDLHALEESTEYDGFDAGSETIKHFWTVVHGMDVEDQKKLLQFVSGSDRVPVGGLSKLNMVITRNGPDCDRLPTSHTCFNVLLLPDYKNFEKLRERLTLAITHATGFGML